MAVLGQRAGMMLTPNELVLAFGGCYLCATFDENRSRSATMRVRTDRHRQTKFIICPVLYAIAMGQMNMTKFGGLSLGGDTTH